MLPLALRCAEGQCALGKQELLTPSDFMVQNMLLTN